MDDATPTTPNTFSQLAPPAEDATLDLTGQRLGDYQITRRLGQGGMGQVYLAEQISLRRKVALKILKPELANDSTALARFKVEAEAIARVTHANIVQVYAIGQVDRISFMALEYVEGRNLREFLLRKGPPELFLAISIIRQVASALLRASEAGIIHRDIKPENILLTRKGEVKVADFGLSRNTGGDRPAMNLTQSGVTMGTPLYMSPEQVEGKVVDCRTDIYSLGVTSYHMLAGQPPYQGSNAFEVALQHVRGEVTPLSTIRPDLPPELCAIVQKMMARDPAGRYPTGRELLKDLSQLREDLGTQTAAMARHNVTVELVPVDAAPTPSILSSLTLPAFKPSARPRLWLGLAFGGSVLLALFVGLALAWAIRPGRAASANNGSESGEKVNEKPRKNDEEESLRTLVDGFLKAEKEPRSDINFVMRLCQELGMLLMREKRFGEAEEFFRRMSTVALPQYQPGVQSQLHRLGKLDLAVALGLQNLAGKASESNKLFIELAQPVGPAASRTIPLERMNNWWPAPAAGTKGDTSFRALLVQALQNNKRNGIPDDKVPSVLLELRDGKKPSSAKP